MTYRAAVIAESDRVVTAIAAVDTIEELIEVMSSIAWPAISVRVVEEPTVVEETPSSDAQ